MAKAKVFMSGNSQAVRLPKAFRFDGAEVDIIRRGDETVLRESKPDMRKAVEALRELGRLIDLPDDPPPETIET